MSDVTKPICVKRILIPLDNSRHSFAALQAAVELARHYDAEIEGLFVEDINLLKLAEMPFHQEVGEYTAIIRELSTDGLSRGIIVQSRWVVQSFRKMINQTELKSDFVVLRGEVSETIRKESQKYDLIILGKSGTNILGRDKLGSTTKKMIGNHRIPLMLVEENNQLGYPMILLYENSPVGNISLETARDLLDPDETLIILLNKDNPEAFTETKKQLKKWALAHQVNISIESYKSHTFRRFIQLIDGLKTGLFILPHNADPTHQTITQLCLDMISLPVLLIRFNNR